MDLTGMSRAELEALIKAAGDEIHRKWVLESANERASALQAEALQAQGIKPGEPWRRPVAVGYPEGWELDHDGHTWVNRVPNNFHEPGVAGWRIKHVEGQPPPPFVKPVQPADAYEVGEIVTHEGQVFRSVFNQGDGLNYWSPSEMPEYWELVTDNGDDPDPGEGDEVPVWVRPIWAGEEGGAYAYGARVRYPDAGGPIYVSVHDGWNTWPPDEYGWELEGQ